MSDVKAARPVWKPAGKVHASEQPFQYPLEREFVEPDWRRLPGYKDVTAAEWEAALWQRRHTVKNLKELQAVFGPLLPASLLESMERDIKERATMSILIPPQMLNTMDEKDLWNDPVRRYMLPAFDDRNPDWPSHPKSSRDSLHESDMWAVEGLTHRYPTKVLAEMLSTCPQYCGHCTRMDLVGNDVPQVVKLRFQLPQKDRYEQMLDYLRKTPSVRDVVVSGGDIANMPITQLEPFVSALMDIPNIKDIRLATRSLEGFRTTGQKSARARSRFGAAHACEQRTPGYSPGRESNQENSGNRISRRSQSGCAAARRQHQRERASGVMLHAARSRQNHAVLLLYV